MPHSIRTDKNSVPRLPKSLYAGAIASFLTQPFQVLKTNMIVSPTLYLRDLHAKIVTKGWRQYMRGGTLAVVRQGYGFTIYTGIIEQINREFQEIESINKYFRFSVAALVGKTVAMFFEAPLTLLKTRMEVVSDRTIRGEMRDILSAPRQQLFKGLNATLVREGVFSLVHYNAYRFLKDDFFQREFGYSTTFYPAFLAGVFAITLSQPFEVIRSKVTLEGNSTFWRCAFNIFSKQGWKGFFVGYMPRLLRKPINSGICWTILEAYKDQ